VAASEEPRRERPTEPFPEWTSRTHRHVVKEAEPEERRTSAVGARLPRSTPRGPLDPESRRALLTLGLAVLAITVGVLAILRPRRIAPESVRPAHELASPDAQLEEAARLRLEHRPDLASLPVQVRVKDEVVVVRGRVPDAATREKLLDCLRMTPGVKGVVDQTASEPPPAER
jgi:hypothetical protein